ncbi:hypothetical protein [Glacieibacterium sp.]|uniref:hypothetical protein n=1 Tax=Glacieibacterium sp. TaxID=2860237 RepID=UPI003B006D3C
MFVEAIKGAATATEIYKQRKSIAVSISKLIQWIRRKNVILAVFGAGGCGKSTLGLLMRGDLKPDTGAGGYEETTGVEKFSLSGNTLGYLIIPPGQSHRIPQTWPELFRLISAGKSNRIINVVAAGFHSTELEKSRIFPGQVFDTDDAFIKAYIDDNLLREINALREIVPHIIAAPGKVKMVTLITKQDLWWTNRHMVEDSYSAGEYGKLISEITSRKGTASFSHTYVSAALVKQNLKTADGVAIAPTIAGYDDSTRNTNLRNASSKLLQLVGR